MPVDFKQTIPKQNLEDLVDYILGEVQNGG